MNQLVVCLLLVGLVSSASVNRNRNRNNLRNRNVDIDEVDWEEASKDHPYIVRCDGTPASDEGNFEIRNLQMSKYPPTIEGGKPGSVNVSITAQNKVTMNVMDLAIEVTKIKGLFGRDFTPSFCILGFGSCTYEDVCDMMSTTEDPFARQIVEMIEGHNGDIECPLEPYTLSVSNHKLDLPTPPNVPGLPSAAAGTYRIKMRILSRDSLDDRNPVEQACFYMAVTTVEPEEDSEECTGWFCW